MEKKKKKLHERMWFWILLALLLVFAWRALMNTDSPAPPEDREYIEVTVDQLYDELSANALKAKDTYTDAYVAVTGKVRVIDSDGTSIAIYPIEYETLDGFHCKLMNDEQREKIKEYSVNDVITVKGKITEVDGTWPYKMEVDSIE